MSRARAWLVPLLLGAALFSLYAFLRNEPLVLGRYGDVRDTLFGKDLRWLLFLALVPLVYLVGRIVNTVVFDVVMSRRRNVVAPQLLREILSIVVYFVFLAWATSTIFGYSLTGWLATGSVLAVVLGFALQDTLGNLFAGISLHLEDTFDVGDVVRTGEFIGVVEAVRWRGTRLRTFDNHLVVLPNSYLARERVEVFPLNNLNGRILTIGIDYNVPPATVIDVLVQAMANVEGVSRDIPAIARLAGFDDSSMRYEIKYFMRNFSHRDTIDAEVRKAVWYALKRNGIPIPFPIRTLVRYQPPERGEHTVDREELVDRLQAVDILSPLSVDAHEALARDARVHFYSKGETILRHGAAGDSMFVVHDGTVSVRVPDETSAGWRELAKLGPGSVFGEMALLTGETRAADVVATTDVSAFEIGKGALQPVLVDHPQLATAIAAKVAARRDALDSARAGSREDAQRSILSRISAWFGLQR